MKKANLETALANIQSNVESWMTQDEERAVRHLSKIEHGGKVGSGERTGSSMKSPS